MDDVEGEPELLDVGRGPWIIVFQGELDYWWRIDDPPVPLTETTGSSSSGLLSDREDVSLRPESRV